MFPNVRLMIVAMLASIVAIICGMGVFAAFRVNHEPFARLPNGNAPLQLVFDSAAPRLLTDAPVTPFGLRFQLNATSGETPDDAGRDPPPDGVTVAATEPPLDAPAMLTDQESQDAPQAAPQAEPQTAAPSPSAKPAADSKAPRHRRLATRPHRPRKPSIRTVVQPVNPYTAFAQPFYQPPLDTTQTEPAKKRRTAGNSAGNTASR